MDKRFLTIDDLTNLPAPQWLIEGLFEAKSLVMLAGPSYSFKSFLLLDWLLHMAVGRDWNNRKTVPCKVAYVLGEGKSSLVKRIYAWMEFNDLTPEEREKVNQNFIVTFEVPQLHSKASVDNFLADLSQEGYKPDVLAIDTFARSFVGGDENDARDVGLWVEQADRLRQLGYGVIFLHHTKKNTEFGVQFRGSSAIMGAMDTAFTLIRDNNYATLKCEKQKDHDEGPALRFRRVIIGSNENESCVLVPAPILDERFKAPENHEPLDPKKLLSDLLEDQSFKSDRERAKALSAKMGISEAAAQTKISRKRREATEASASPVPHLQLVEN